MNELDAVREDHKASRGQGDMCQHDGDPWPCHTRIVLNALDARDTVLVGLSWALWGPYVDDVKRLAAADRWRSDVDGLYPR